MADSHPLSHATIHKTARFSVKPESRPTCEAAIREFVEHIRQNEPGTLLYVSLRDAADSNAFLHVMAFADETAEHTHRTSAAVQRFVEILYPETVDGVAFVDYTAVAST